MERFSDNANDDGSVRLGYRETPEDLFQVIDYSPSSDHTTGESTGYMFWFSKPPKVTSGFSTNLNMIDLPASGTHCLSFWYQMVTSSTFNFEIAVTASNKVEPSDNAWSPPDSNITRWTKGQLSVHALYKHKIVFQFFLPTDEPRTAYIALDDISLKSGQCEAPVSCDFDVDWCSWSNINTDNDDWNWAKFTGPPAWRTKWTGPKYDHTLARDGGSYLYLTVDPNSQSLIPRIEKQALIESMPTTLDGVKCLSFWTQLIGSDATVQPFIVRYSPHIATNRLVQRLSDTISGPKQRWNKVSITIDPLHFPDTQDFVIRLQGEVVSVYDKLKHVYSKSFIALDDIVLSDGKCEDSSEVVLYCDWNRHPI